MIYINVLGETFIDVSDGVRRKFTFWHKSDVLADEVKHKMKNGKIKVCVYTTFKKGSRGIEFECSLRDENNCKIVFLEKPLVIWADYEGKPRVSRDAEPIAKYFSGAA